MAAFEPYGLGYRVTLEKYALTVGVDRLTERSGQTYGELTVEQAPAGHVLRAYVSLSSIRDRKTLSDTLSDRVPGPPWEALLERFFLDVLDRERSADEIVNVGQAEPRPEVDFMLRPFLVADVPTILYAREGTGKSTLAAAVAASVAAGIGFLDGWTVSKPSNVLVLDWEADARAWNDNLVAVSAAFLPSVPSGVFYQRMSGSLPDNIYNVAAAIEEYKAGLVIIDSVTMASPKGGSGADASESATQLFKAIRHLGVTTLLIDHVNKASGKDAADRPYGSVFKPALARATYELRVDEERLDGNLSTPEGESWLVLVHTKANLTAKQYPVHLTQSRLPGIISYAEINLLAGKPPKSDVPGDTGQDQYEQSTWSGRLGT